MVEEKDVPTILNELVRRANESTRRLRALEERTLLMETRLSSIQDSILRNTEETRKGISTLIEKIKDTDTQMLRIDNEILRINKNADKFAKKTELKEVENTMSFFSPLKTGFVTKEEVERMIIERSRR